MIHHQQKDNKKDKSKIKYVVLKVGEILREGDEYNTHSDWRSVPDFLFGEKVTDGTTQWRRPSKSSDSSTQKKRWFSFLFGG